jgi:hypothetical protein
MLADRQVRALLGACRETHAEEIDCEEFLAGLGPYADALAAGAVVPDGLAKLVEHDALCANCHEERVALVEMVRALGAAGA